MGILKYKKQGESDWHTIPSVLANVINIVQAKGQSTTDVMSQKAVTDELDTVNSAITAHTADTTVHHTSTSAVTSGSTDVITSGGVFAQLDGIKLKKITQSAYDALVQAEATDPNTLYFITD